MHILDFENLIYQHTFFSENRCSREIQLKETDYKQIITTPGTFCFILDGKTPSKNIFYHSFSGSKYLFWWCEVNNCFTIYNDVGRILCVPDFVTNPLMVKV